MPEKLLVIKALDEALDKEIIHYGKRFVENPNMSDLERLCKLVTVDTYTDEYLEEHGTTAKAMKEKAGFGE